MEPRHMPWKQAWKVLPSWQRLHRIARIDDFDHGDFNEDPDDMTSILGVACCGAKGHFIMPGLFSRMGMPRCAHCARIAGVEDKPGIPGNGPVSGPRDQWQEDYE